MLELRLNFAFAKRDVLRSIDFVFASTSALVFGVGGTFFRDGVFALGMVGKTTRGGSHLVMRRERRATSTFFDFVDCCFFLAAPIAVDLDSEGTILIAERNGMEEEIDAPIMLAPTLILRKNLLWENEEHHQLSHHNEMKHYYFYSWTMDHGPHFCEMRWRNVADRGLLGGSLPFSIRRCRFHHLPKT